MRMEFDYSLDPVTYSAFRREKAVMISIPIDNNVLLVSTELSVDIDQISQKLIKLIGKI